MAQPKIEPTYPPKNPTQSELLILLGKLLPIISQSIPKGSRNATISEQTNIIQNAYRLNSAHYQI